MGKPTICICENKDVDQLRFAVTAKLISAIVFTARIEQSFFFLNPKFQASSLVFVTVQPSLCRTWSEPKLLGFSHTDSIVI